MVNTDRLKTQFQAVGQGEVVRAFGEIAAASRASSLAVRSSSAGIAGSLGTVAGSLAVLGTAVAAATAAIGVASVKAAAPIENLQMRFRFAFGDMADAAMASSEKIAKSLSRDVEEVQALVLTAKNLEVPNVGRAVSAAYNVSARNVPSQDIEKTAQSLVEIFGKIQQLDKFGGREIRSMLSASLPIGTIKEIVKAMGVSEEGGEMSGRAALPKLIEVLEQYGGNAALQESKTMSGLLRQTRDKLGDVWESIGLQLLPVVKKIVDGLMPMLDNTAAIAKIMATVVGIIAYIGRHVAQNVAQLGAISGAIIGMMSGLWDIAFWIVGKLVQGITWALSKLPGLGVLGDESRRAGVFADVSGRNALTALNPMNYKRQYDKMMASVDTYFYKPLKEVEGALRSVKNGSTGKTTGANPLADAGSATTAAAAKAGNEITKAVQRYIIGGGSQAGQWMRMLDVGGRAAGAGAIPVKLSEQTGDAFKKFLVQALSETLVDVLKSPQGKRAIAAAASAR